jgi:uncharacterized protein (DUF305 family)
VNAIRAILVVGVLCLAGCSTAAPGTAASPGGSSAPTPAAGFGGTDRAWIEINLAMEEQVLPLLELVPARSKSADVRALALQIKAFTDAELGTLRQLRDRGALPSANAHKGMPMPGIVTTDEVAKAAKLSGPAFDKAALEQIKAYLDQGQNLARSEGKSGLEPQTRELALQILRNREQALSTVRTIQDG